MDNANSNQRFSHHRLDAFHVALAALVACDAIAKALPRGYSALADQLRRASQGAYLQLSEAAAREGSDAKNRYRVARGESNEAGAAVEAVRALKLVDEAPCNEAITLLVRLSSMLTRLGGFRA
jgi:four helix bundle protein